MSLLIRVALIIVVALLPPLGMQVYDDAMLRHDSQAKLREQALLEARAVAAELSVQPGGMVPAADLDVSGLRDRIAAYGLPSDASVTVADRDGRLLVRLPDQSQSLPSEFRALLGASEPGALEVVEPDGVRRMVGYVPVAPSDARALFVGVGFSMAPAHASDEAAALRGYGLIAAGMVAALAVAAGLLRGATIPPSRAIRPPMMPPMGPQPTDTGSERRAADLARQLAMATREREATQAQLHRSERMHVVGQLTGGVAHDFNNLLTAIIGNLELASVRASDRPDVMRLLQGAMRAADRGAALTQRMLAFGRRQYLRRETVDVAALLAGLTDRLARSTGPQIRIHIVADPGARPALADPSQIEQAVLNLAVNARDAMPDGGVVTISLDEDHVGGALGHPAGLSAGDYMRISVADTGAGMDAETQARAFEPFFTTRAVGRGSGLGLPMVQGLAAQSGGGTAIDSAPGLGTTVSIWLPCAPRTAPPAPLRFAPKWAAGGSRILVVDDDADVLEFVACCLEDAGYTVMRASDGREALATLRVREPPDLIITDLGMPGMSGQELSVAARLLYPMMPVLIATGYADTASANAGEGNPPVLAKPFKAADLLERVCELLGRAAAPGAAEIEA